eukprot:scaffold7099_cov281-Pinguiococcus_pyrenoidosus.AAC.15
MRRSLTLLCKPGPFPGGFSANLLEILRERGDLLARGRRKQCVVAFKGRFPLSFSTNFRACSTGAAWSWSQNAFRG